MHPSDCRCVGITANPLASHRFEGLGATHRWESSLLFSPLLCIPVEGAAGWGDWLALGLAGDHVVWGFLGFCFRRGGTQVANSTTECVWWGNTGRLKGRLSGKGRGRSSMDLHVELLCLSLTQWDEHQLIPAGPALWGCADMIKF